MHGFSLIDPQVTISDIAPAHVPNNESTCSDEIKSCIDDAVSNELISGDTYHGLNNPKLLVLCQLYLNPMEEYDLSMT